MLTDVKLEGLQASAIGKWGFEVTLSVDGCPAATSSYSRRILPGSLVCTPQLITFGHNPPPYPLLPLCHVFACAFVYSSVYLSI